MASERAIAQPTELILDQLGRQLVVKFNNGEQFSLPCEYLRVYSPSAEVRGPGARPGRLPTGKREVNIKAIEPVGHYAVKLIFDDGHQSGLYSWSYLYDLGSRYTEYWKNYLASLAELGISRDGIP